MTDFDIEYVIATDCGHWRPGCMGKVPHYCSDLNAMHEVLVSHPMSSCDFVHTLARIVGVDLYKERTLVDIGLIITSTARQQAEAYVRMIGKYKYDKPGD